MSTSSRFLGVFIFLVITAAFTVLAVMLPEGLLYSAAASLAILFGVVTSLIGFIAICQAVAQLFGQRGADTGGSVTGSSARQ